MLCFNDENDITLDERPTISLFQKITDTGWSYDLEDLNRWN